MIALGRRTDEQVAEDYPEESGSYQRMLATMYDGDDLSMTEDPILAGAATGDGGDALLGLRLDSL